MKTNLGDFTPETVKAAFEKLGYEPDPTLFLDRDSECACALGAFVEANAPGAIEAGRSRCVSAIETIESLLGITKQERDSVSAGFMGYKEDELGYACRLAVGLPHNEFLRRR